MPYTPFPEDLDIKTLDTSEAYNFANISCPAAQELAHMYVHIYVHGTEGGTEQIRVKVYSDSGLSTLVDTSDWASLSDRDAIGTYDLNYIRLDFNRKILAANTTYYCVLEAQNYTRNSDTFYIGIVLYSDETWVEPDSFTTIPMDAGIVQIFGYRVRQY
jgi:hypothetical protein